MSNFNNFFGGGGTWHSEAFTSSGVWIKPTNVELIRYILVGGGGGGSTSDLSNFFGGGGGAQTQLGDIRVTGDITVTIGAGGTGAPAGSLIYGSDGSPSTFTGGIIKPITALEGKSAFTGATGGAGGGQTQSSGGGSSVRTQDGSCGTGAGMIPGGGGGTGSPVAVAGAGGQSLGAGGIRDTTGDKGGGGGGGSFGVGGGFGSTPTFGGGGKASEDTSAASQDGANGYCEIHWFE